MHRSRSPILQMGLLGTRLDNKLRNPAKAETTGYARAFRRVFDSQPQGRSDWRVCWDQRSDFGCESRDVPQSGNICAMECATKAGLCRRLSRRVNMIARKNPVKAPRNASVADRLLNVRSPWLVRINPV